MWVFSPAKSFLSKQKLLESIQKYIKSDLEWKTQTFLSKDPLLLL